MDFPSLYKRRCPGFLPLGGFVRGVGGTQHPGIARGFGGPQASQFCRTGSEIGREIQIDIFTIG